MRFHIHAALAALCAIACTVATPAAFAKRITLNDTGLTQCVDHQKNWTSDCAHTDQDAAYGRDVRDGDPTDGDAGFSFRKVCRSGEMAGEGTCPADPALGTGPDDWGCVYDNVSQLTWEAKTDDDGLHDYRRTFTNKGHGSSDNPSDAAWLVKETNGEALCGATNWRLPDVLELEGLVDYGKGTTDVPSGPFIDSTFFPFDFGGMTWSRTVCAAFRNYTWYVSFKEGAANVISRVYAPVTARLVHGPSHSPSKDPEVSYRNRFVPSADGLEVADTWTGLTWQRCEVGKRWNPTTGWCDGYPDYMTWREAFAYAKAHRDGGWRLPNIKEMFSLVDFRVQEPAIDQRAFPSVLLNEDAFASTPINIGGELMMKWLYFDRGSIEQYSADSRHAWAVRMVRGGRN